MEPERGPAHLEVAWSSYGKVWNGGLHTPLIYERDRKVANVLTKQTTGAG